MTDRIIELATQVYGIDKWTEAQIGRLELFAELVRNEAIDECIEQVLASQMGLVARLRELKS